MTNKAQISLEFVVIIMFVVMFSFYFTSSIYNVSQSNKIINTLKTNTLNILNKEDSTSYITNIRHNTVDSNLFIDVFITKVDNIDINLNDYNLSINNLLKTTDYEDINLSIKYM